MLSMVSADQFEVLSDLKVRHMATGAIFSTEPYDNPEDVEVKMTVLTRGQDSEGRQFNMSEVETVAKVVLRRLVEERNAARAGSR